VFGCFIDSNLRAQKTTILHMKKTLLSFSFVTLFFTLFAQSPSLDSAVLGTSYANDVYYSMANGFVSKTLGNSWHIGFAIRNAAPPTNVIRSTSVIVNEGRGVRIFESSQLFTNWNTFDTANYTTWSNPHNSDSSWDIGAFNVNRNESDPFDYGWGSYDMASHDVIGNKIFLVRITTGSGPSTVNTFKKITINKIVFDSQWVFTYANLDNTNSMTVSFGKKDFAGKLFAYYNLLNDSIQDREPAAKWDLLFTRYGAFITQQNQTIFTTTTGVLNNPTVTTSKVQGLPNDSAVAGMFASKITNIGTDWKINPGPGQPSFVIKDSLVYFVRAENGREDKLIFKSFAGSSTGSIVFEKTKTKVATGIQKITPSLSVTLFPNPATTTIHFDLKTIENVNVTIHDITGKVQLTKIINTSQNSIDIEALHAGIYFVTIDHHTTTKVLRLIVQ
jgi:hypothetical protein